LTVTLFGGAFLEVTVFNEVDMLIFRRYPSVNHEISVKVKSYVWDWHVRYVRHLGLIVQKIYPLDNNFPLNKSSSIYTSYPVDKYLSSRYSFEQVGPAYQILEV
jgi:heme/copper-type cytochrome/quinol oxidase subunit 2